MDVHSPHRIQEAMKFIFKDLYEVQYKFNPPFDHYHEQLRFKLYANLSFLMLKHLLGILKS